ncbi:ImmA/IrrE family metallo-endopeptidase [Corynebacterium kozikiae]|uniref:ImmA/IrrE family metallo-endopeptidase n=1 Tax=Corynebacterium kozikiae TaxID=2968469 RepID=UPI00211C54DA|nr:ImmA/IrrE family metallo-endopeptidase [Corynebacterium sp. 76QC2CO]MCQ9343546.1 ImmA/IrrE family metallo-endopeptidase [Corynebacterium sp. 76QC2CO]
MSAVERLLEQKLEEMSISLIERPDLRPDLNACYHDETRSIVVRWGLDPVTRRCAIAHELGHFHHGHTCSSPRAEREADEWAARALLSANLVEDAGRECDGAPSAIAAELGVTPTLLEVWMQMYRAGRIPHTYKWRETG